MNLRDFALERFFDAHEFTARLTLSASDCEPMSMAALLELAAPDDLARWSNLSLGYTDPAGHPELRARIATQYQGFSPREVLYAAPEEAIFVAMHALLSPGDRVVVLEPAYQSLHEIARSIGCDVAPWPIQRTEAGWALDLDLLDDLLSTPTTLLVVNFPHNPTGHHPTPETFARIVALANRRGARVFSDEMYRGLEFGDRPTLPSACELDPRAVTLSGLSKTHALPGLRAGWLATHDADLIARAKAIKDYTTICAPSPAEALAMIALANAEALAQRSRRLVRDNLSFALEQLSGAPATILPPLAGSTCLLEVAAPDDLSHRAIETDGVLVVSASLFGMTEPYVRLGLGRREFAPALEALVPLLEG